VPLDIVDWLRQLGLAQYAPAFRDNHVDGEVLRRLTAEDLRELGVASIGHRRRLLDAIAALSEARLVAADAPKPVVAAGEAERRHMTVLFCDLVDSTSLSARLDVEDLRQALGAYQRCCAEVVERNGGFVAKFMGDGVLAYFGYPRAHEDDAERAVRAGLALIDAIGGLEMGGHSRPRIRVGIATGLVVVGDLIGSGEAYERGVVGETPNLAARLQVLAEPNSVVIAASTRRLTGGLFEYRDLGAVVLKGFGAPVSVWQVRGVSGVQSRFEARHEVGLTQLVGREEELDLLLRRWHQVQEGEGRVVLLIGEPGIGKSRILREFEDRLADEPATRLRFFCSPHHQNSALYPVIRQLEHVAGFGREDSGGQKLAKLEALLGRTSTEPEAIGLIAELLSLPSGGRYPVPQFTPQRRKEKTLEALLAQVVGLAAKQPVLMLFEDVHWIDPTTRELLMLSIERASRLPVLVLVTARPEFTPTWSGHAHVTTLSLTRLTQREGATLVHRVTEGKVLPGEVMEQILARTDGIPLFVEELTKTVLESGLLREEDGRYALSGPLPPLAIPTTLHDSLLARLDRLPMVRQVAQIGAAIGREFSFPLMDSVAKLDGGALREALNELVRSELVFCRGEPPQATYTFKHALVRDAAYDALLRGPRQELHARIATVLEERFPEEVEQQPEVVAQHCALAGFNERAIAYWCQAGRRSVARSAMLEAAVQFQKGLELLAGVPDGPNRQREELELQGGLGRALVASKGPAAPETGKAYERAHVLCVDLGDTGSLVPVLMGQFAHHVTRAELPAARQIAEDLLRLGRAPDQDIARLAGHQAMGACMHETGELTGAIGHHERVLSLYDFQTHQAIASIAAYDPQTIALGLLSLDLFVAGYPDQALARCNEAVIWSRKLNNYTSLCLALQFASRFHVLRHSPQAALDASYELIAIATEQRFYQFLTFANIDRGLFLANLADAKHDIVAARQGIADAGARGVNHDQSYLLGLLAQACERAGQIEEAMDLITRALEMADRTGERWFEPELHRIRGEWLITHRSGEYAEAAACFERSLTMARARKAKMWELRAAMSLARLLRRQGHAADAPAVLQPVYDRFTEGFDTVDQVAANQLLGELGDAARQ